MAKKLEPLGSRILIKPVKVQEKTKSGLFLPDLVKEVPQEGTVVAVGPGRRNEKGARVPIEIKTGDRVIYAKFSGTQYQDEAQDYYLIDDSQILAKLE